MNDVKIDVEDMEPVKVDVGPLDGKVVLTISHGITEQTGFGQQTRKLSMMLRDMGATVYNIHPRYRGVPRRLPEDNDVIMLPWGNHPHGEDACYVYLDMFKPDYVISLADIWDKQFLNKDRLPPTVKHRDYKWLGWFPFDTSNCVPFWRNNLMNMDMPIVMSEFGLELMKQQGLFGVHIPHSFNTDEYHPVTAEEKKQIRREQGLPEDAFVVLCVAHNQVRKKLDRTLKAFASFCRDKPNAILWFHSTPTADNGQGWDLLGMAENMGIGDKVLFSNMAQKLISDNFVTNHDMARMYQASDVHLLLTGGEGFGLPILEASACGIPNITTEFTTGPELVGVPESGSLVKVDTIEDHMNGGHWALANIEQASAHLDKYYKNPGLAREHGKNGAEYAHAKYTDEKIDGHWREFFAQLPGLLDAKEKFYGQPAEGLKPMRYRRN